LKGRIRDVLGFNDMYKAVIVGAGRLGGAIASYAGFAKYGLYVVAMFDVDEDRIGSVMGGVLVQSIENLETIIQRHDVHMAILTVPAEAAQTLGDRLVAAGIRAIWNFAPTSLSVPSDVFVRHEHISVGLAELAYYLKRNDLMSEGWPSEAWHTPSDSSAIGPMMDEQ
jgi:redox-sensing transcriptional repressor